MAGLPDAAMLVRFESFIRAAARICEVPRAVICLRDLHDRWFTSTPDAGFVENRHDGCCCDAILRHHGPLVMQDARPEGHTAAVGGGEPPIRFYAGVTLRDPDGRPVGALLATGDTPHRMSMVQTALLADLGAGVEAVIGLGDSVAALGEALDRDYLTGLLSRRRFDRLLADAVGMATAPGAGRQDACAVVCLDIDGFKAINDAYGHAVGDAVLTETARRLSAACRPGDHVARLSGDELAILMTAPASPPQAQRLAGRILDDFRAPLRIEGIGIPVRLSLGIAAAPYDAGVAATLLRCADRASYEAKRTGGHRHRHFGSACPRDDAGARRTGPAVPGFVRGLGVGICRPRQRRDGSGR